MAIATRCNKACPVCGRRHWFHLENQPEPQRFVMHEGAVAFVATVTEKRGPFLLCDWEVRDHSNNWRPR